MGNVTLRGISINYSSIGKGRDVVLIHGLAANLGFWNPVVLMTLARHYRVTFFDLRGHGKSDMPASGYTSAEMAKDLLSLLDYLNITKADVIGHSFGGVVALHGAILAPERIRSLVLADTRIRTFEPTLTAQDLCRNEKFSNKLARFGITLPEGENETGLWLLEKLASPEWQKKQEIMKEIQGFLPFGGVRLNGRNRAAERWLDLLNKTTARMDFTNTAGLTVDKILRLQQPVLVICGENTTARRSSASLKMHLQNCETGIIEGAGHFFPVTQPLEFLAIVQQFLLDTRLENRRCNRRFPLNLQVDIFAGQGASCRATTLNVSRSGLFVSGGQKLSLGTELDLFADIDSFSERIQLSGKVVRLSDPENYCHFRYGIELSQDGVGQSFWESFLSRHHQLLPDTSDFAEVRV